MSIKVFISYAHADHELHKELNNHLSSLSYSGEITIWQDQEIPAGANWENQINTHLNGAHMILLLVSASFIASKYCWNKEVQVALERHKAGTARVIPIILKPVQWHNTPLGQLQALPTGAKPITQWDDRDAALEDVVRNIQHVVEHLHIKLREEAMRNEKIGANNITSSLLAPQPPTILASPLIQESMELNTHSMQSLPPTVTRPPIQIPPPKIASGRKRSRRAVIKGLAAIGIVGGGGAITWWIFGPHPLYTYHRHSAVVNAVAWSPNGKRIASGSYDQTVQVWDATDGGNAFTYHGHSSRVTAVAWSPDGKRIASGSFDKTVQVWDATDGGNAFTYSGHSDVVNTVAWSPDGKRIASGSFDKTVQVWDATGGGNAFTYHGHLFFSVRAVAWSPDSKRIASGGYDDTVQVWVAL